MKLAKLAASILFLAAIAVEIAAASAWAPLPSLPAPRWLARAERIGDKVYVLGGSETDATNTVYVLDLVTWTWSTAAPLPEARAFLCSGVLGGKLYAVAGDAPGPSVRATGWVFDPATNAWTPIAPLPAPRTNAACAVAGGRLLVISGAPVNSASPVADVFVYDPVSDTWSSAAPIPTPRKLAAAVAVGDRVVVAGGHTSASDVSGMVAAVEVYDAPTGTWTVAPPLPVPVTGAAMVESGGRAFVLGGVGPVWGPALAGVSSLRPGDRAWREEPSLPAGAFASSAVATPAGSVVLVGGNTGEAPLADVREWTFAPDIVAVRDVPNDQGGRVVVRWTASFLDRVPANPIGEYWVWREVPAAQALALLRAGARTLASDEGRDAPRPGVLRTSVEAGQVHYWEFVAAPPAHGHAGYSYVAETFCDSLPGSNPLTYFMVEAVRPATGEFWSSAPVGGCSVDDLAPAAPVALGGEWAAGAMHLRWRANTEPDLAGYRIHRGERADFVPEPANQIGQTNDTSYVDAAGAPHFYKLVAVDRHGNAGPASLACVECTLDAAPPTASRLRLAAPTPNPASGPCDVAFTLARSGRVTLAVYDVNGRLARTLVDGERPAGENRSRFDLADAGGRPLAAGLYFIRLSDGREARRTPLVVVR